MFRSPPLSCALLIVTLGVALIVVPAPVLGQDRSTPERLDRLERDLNMLQRQVYRGQPQQMAGGDSGAAVNVELRMNRLEEQMRDLTGRVEEFMNQVTQVRQRFEQLNGDVETRFSQGAGASGPFAAAEPAPSRPAAVVAPRPPRQFPPPPADAAEEEQQPFRLMPSGGRGSRSTAAGGIGDVPAPVFGTLTPPGVAPPGADQLASAAPAGHPVAGALPGASAAAQYNQAFGLLKQADYPAAETALKAFIEQHPKDPMAGNAQYWLGETYFTRGRYQEAASAFAEGYKHYPKGTKAADGLLKLGMSLARANQKQNACVALGQLDHDFPNPGAAIKSRAEAEKKHLGC